MGDVSATVRTQSFDCTKVCGVVEVVFGSDESATSPLTTADVDKPDKTVEEEDAFTPTMFASSCSVASFLELSELPCILGMSSDRDGGLSSSESAPTPRRSVTQGRIAANGLSSPTTIRRPLSDGSKTDSFSVDTDPCRRFRLSPKRIETF